MSTARPPVHTTASMAYAASMLSDKNGRRAEVSADSDLHPAKATGWFGLSVFDRLYPPIASPMVSDIKLAENVRPLSYTWDKVHQHIGNYNLEKEKEY